MLIFVLTALVSYKLQLISTDKIGAFSPLKKAVTCLLQATEHGTVLQECGLIK